MVLQAALSLVLLVAAGLFVQSLSKLQNVDMKLDATNRYIAHINPQAAGYKSTEVEALYQTIVDRFHAIPGVVKVGLATYTPMEENNWSSGVKVQGEAGHQQGRVVGERQRGVLRLRGHARGDGARIHDRRTR